MSSSDVTKDGIEGQKPGREAITGGRDRGPRTREEPMVPRAEFSSYYGKPVLNQIVWHPTIPAYFFTGGLAGASSLLAFGADRTDNFALRRVGRYAGFGAIVVSAGLLIEDLGKPSRFHHMLRMMKVTSPMSVGTWIVTAYGAGAGAAAASELTGLLPRLGRAAGAWAAALAPLLGSYTAALVADTAVPVWHDDYEVLPFVFVGSALAAGGGLAMATVAPEDASPARRMAVLGAAVETAASQWSRRRLGMIGEVYDSGIAGVCHKVAEGATVGGLATALVLGRRPIGAKVAGALLMTGSLATRLAVYYAGKASAADPKYVVEPQRARLRAADATPALRARGPAVPHITSAVDAPDDLP